MAARPKTAKTAAIRSAADAERWARKWIAAWNSCEVERVLRLFHDDARFSSPKAAATVDTPEVHGKLALREYWTKALTRIRSLHFELDTVNWDRSARTLIIRYVASFNGQRAMAAEILEFDRQGLVINGVALYGAQV